jgi:hypothetical protein
MRNWHLCDGCVFLRNNDGLLFADVQNIASLLVLQTVLDKLDLES